MVRRIRDFVRDQVDRYAPKAGYYRSSGFRFHRLKETKVFCIGRNKTGTTSLKTALSDLGYRVGNQHRAERLMAEYRDRNFQPIIQYCEGADAFQDVPFSLPFTYMVMDQAFPGSKFILSVRDPDDWYASYIRHQKQVVGTDEIPTPEELKRHPYVREGWLYDVKLWAGRPEEKFYDETFLKERFVRYNRNVKDYFQFKDNLLILNVADDGAYQELCAFLGEKPLYETMPWKNKTRQ